MKSLISILVFAAMVWACTQLDEIGRNSFYDDTFPVSSTPQSGPVIPDANWICGVVEGTVKAYHQHSFGGSEDEGVIDNVHHRMVVY